MDQTPQSDLHPSLVNIHKRSKGDLLKLIDALVSEDPAKQAFLLHTEQRKAAYRVEAIRSLERTNDRLRNDLTKMHFEREDLIPRVPADRQPEWLKERNAKREEAKRRATGRSA